MLSTIWRWLARIFFTPRHDPRKRPPDWPTREEMAQLPVFKALGLKDIVEVQTPEGARRAYEEIVQSGVVGFDTESKPTFLKGEVSTGPHVAQFSTLERAYVFVLHDHECRRIAGELIALETLKKVGFGLSGDLRQIKDKLRVHPRGILELGTLFAEKGYGRGVGAKVGVALTLKKRLIKSKKITTSNWKQRRLSDQQILYAANDAYAAIHVFQALTAS